MAGEELIECPVCCEEVEPKDFMCIEECGHGLCRECYQAYLESKLAEGVECVKATCSDEECMLILPDAIWKSLLPEKQYKRYQYFMFKSYVEINPRSRYCPGRGCSKIVELKKVGLKNIDVICEFCKEDFCFNCVKAAH